VILRSTESESASGTLLTVRSGPSGSSILSGGTQALVPPEPIRQLRDLTRTRIAVTRERGREVQRLEKLLEDALLTELPEEVSGLSGGIGQRLATVPFRDRNRRCEPPRVW